MSILILASSSPRRRELLLNLGLKFEVEIMPVPEHIPPGMKPDAVVKLLSEKKARAVAAKRTTGLVIGSDTIVVWDHQILGKPAGEQEAEEMLDKLQGSSHYVYSGVAVIDAASDKIIVDYRRTKVTFKSMSVNEIKAYVSSGESLDKAGAYGIQGRAAVFIEGIEGCYFNVMGLPLECLATILKSFNYDIL